MTAQAAPGFGERLAEAVARTAPVCVGLDPFLDRVPGVAPGMGDEGAADAVLAFGRAVIGACAGIVPALKPQAAFFEALGAPGVRVMATLCREARDAGLVVVADAKRGDIGSTAEAYARALLDDDGPVGADAVTLSPWLGPESLAPFRRRVGKGTFVLVRTSNPGALAWQAAAAPLVAGWIAAENAGAARFGDVGAVVGATLPPAEAASWRARLPKTWLLVPGFGAQGAGVDEVVPHFLPDGTGALVTSSREVLYPRTGLDDDVADAVRSRARALAAAGRAAAARARGAPAR